MEIKDKSGLLKPEKIDKAFDNLLEELDQNAAGPELKDGAELKNEATVEKEPESAALSIDNKDVYCDKTHEQEESVEGVVVKEEESQTANGPELGTAGELKNEATVEGEGESTEPSVNNKDVYCDACHDQKEAGEGVVVKEDILSELELETDPEAEDAEDEFGAESEKAPEAEDPVAVEDTVNEVNSLTEEAEGEEEKKEEDEKEESEKSEDDSKKEENSKSEEKEEHAEEEEKETVDESFESLFTLLRTINEEASQLAAGPELKDGAELKNEATVKGEGESTEPSVDNKDVYCDKTHEQEESVEGVVVKEEESQVANGPELGAAGELKNEATVEKEPEAVAPSVDNKDVYCDACHDQKEAGEGVVVKEEESQVANGPELSTAGELKNEATVEGEGESEEPSVDNKEVYTANLHKQVENVVGIVVEAAANCRKSGKKATLTNICESLMKLYEESEADPKDMMGVGKEFADKSYDVDASLVSKEMNGSDKFENYEKLQGEEADAALSAQVPAEAVHESVKYTSLREACMLDEDYFISDTYTKQTSEEKIQKLTEQVSLLMAREANDPLYDELLKESIYCKRLQEQCRNKYASQARVKAEKIIKK